MFLCYSFYRQITFAFCSLAWSFNRDSYKTVLFSLGVQHHCTLCSISPTSACVWVGGEGGDGGGASCAAAHGNGSAVQVVLHFSLQAVTLQCDRPRLRHFFYCAFCSPDLFSILISFFFACVCASLSAEFSMSVRVYGAFLLLHRLPTSRRDTCFHEQWRKRRKRQTRR